MTWWKCFCVLHVKDQTAGNPSSILGASQINGRHICIFISCIKLGVPKIASKIVVYRPPINIPEFGEAKAIFFITSLVMISVQDDDCELNSPRAI